MPESIFLVPWFVLVGIAITMFIQGWMVLHEQHGYQENPKYKKHPEIEEIKGDTGVLMGVTFNQEPEDEFSELHARIHQLKMQELFEEPSSYEDEDDDYLI